MNNLIYRYSTSTLTVFGDTPPYHELQKRRKRIRAARWKATTVFRPPVALSVLQAGGVRSELGCAAARGGSQGETILPPCGACMSDRIQYIYMYPPPPFVRMCSIACRFAGACVRALASQKCTLYTKLFVCAGSVFCFYSLLPRKPERGGGRGRLQWVRPCYGAYIGVAPCEHAYSTIYFCARRSLFHVHRPPHPQPPLP